MKLTYNHTTTTADTAGNIINQIISFTVDYDPHLNTLNNDGRVKIELFDGGEFKCDLSQSFSNLPGNPLAHILANINWRELCSKQILKQ